MEELKQLESDLGYVREVVRKSEHDRSPAVVYLLWAAITLAGFAVVDFAPKRGGFFWLVAGPMGGLISARLGRRQSVRRGQVRREEGIRWGLHWGGMMAAILLAVPLAVTGVIQARGFGNVILLVVALTYFLAGVHLERPLAWIGALIAVGYIALFFIPAYGWTFVGVLVAAALAATPMIGGRESAAPAN
ncbi:MAG: hypothetical protein DMF51_13845 [Acidobacteria bacterium]|nr:MAG: hypothetical protein DMF51_13845 [Acidobacteriota bacterium]